jgi:hypothetical protein
MVSTLRITSIVVFVVAGLVVVLVAGPSSMVPNLLDRFDLRNDPEIERILSEPGVVERWKEAHGDRVASAQDTTPALVREAEGFKNILDPPPPPPSDTTTSKSTRATTGRPVVKPVVSSAKFDLVGTTVSADNSFAYIRLQDKSYQWARIGDEIGHLTIKEIRNGSIVCWDGHSEVELTAESVPETASLLEASGPSVTRASLNPRLAERSAAGDRITGQPVARPWTSGLSAAEDADRVDAEVEDLVDRLRELQRNAPASDDANLTPEDRKAAIEKLITEYKAKSARVSAEEAEKVEDLGRELNEATEPSPADRLRGTRPRLVIPRSPRR